MKVRTINFKESNIVVRDEFVEALRKEINRYPLIEDCEVRDYISEAQNGSLKARDKVVNSNLRIVWSIAANYGMADNFMDMYQNGCIGLIKAVNTFDVTRETLFSTWIAINVVKYINMGLELESRVVRPSVSDVRAKNPYTAVSMDAPLASDEDGEKTLLDTFASDMKCDTFSEVHDMRVKLNYLLKGLKDIEKAVVCGIFGFGCDEVSEYTLSKKFNLTEERIRQIKWEAIAKMQKLI